MTSSFAHQRIASVGGTAIFALLSIASVAGQPVQSRKVEACSSSLSDNELERIVSSVVDLSIPHGTEVKRIDCKYYVTTWALPAVPDSEVFLIIGENGRILQKDREIFR